MERLNDRRFPASEEEVRAVRREYLNKIKEDNPDFDAFGSKKLVRLYEQVCMKRFRMTLLKRISNKKLHAS